jgi:hypothetical protein
MLSFGPVRVTDETFRATIRPASSAPMAVCYLGFVPPTAEADAEVDSERLERLRALGYVQ